MKKIESFKRGNEKGDKKRGCHDYFVRQPLDRCLVKMWEYTACSGTFQI